MDQQVSSNVIASNIQAKQINLKNKLREAGLKTEIASPLAFAFIKLPKLNKLELIKLLQDNI